jgi:hypothetical protein
MQNTTPIHKVPKDFDPMKIAEVTNPLAEDFKHSFDGNEIIIPEGKTLQAPENVARLMAEHIARKMIRSKHKAELAKKKKSLGENSESYLKIERSAIPMWDQQVEEIVKQIMVVKSSLKDTTIMERVNVKEDLPKAPKNA